MLVSEDDYISHHGIKGQHWGVRNGPPYPLNDTRTNVATSKRRTHALSVSEGMYKTLDTFDYGCIINGKKYTEDALDEVDWSKYRTLPVDVFEKEKIGVCWDFTNWQNKKLNEAKIPHQTHMFVMDTDSGPITHTFTTFTDEHTNQSYWFEQSFYKYRGIHKIDSYKDVISVIAKHYDKSGTSPFDVYEFDPEGMDKGLTDQEFFDRASANDPVYQRK